MERVEEYLEAIFRLKERGEKVTVTRLSKLLDVTPASVTQMLKKLLQLGFISHKPYGEIVPTRRGEELGRKILRKHRVAEELLKYLQVPEGEIHDKACELEHHLSDEVERAIHRKVEGEKSRSPSGLLPLTALLEGEEGVVERLRGGRGLCQRVSAMGLTPGTRVKMLRSSMFGGPILVSVRGTTLALGRGVATKILVKVD